MAQPSESLYRTEAINAHYTHQYGEAYLLPKVNQLWLSLIIAVWVVIALVFIVTQPFAQTVEVQGWIANQTLPIQINSKESAGIVERLFVANGDWVTKGQALLRVRRQSHSLLGDNNVKHNIARLKAEQELAAQALLQQQLNTENKIANNEQSSELINSQINTINQQLKNTQSRLKTLAEQKENLAKLAASGLTSKAQVQGANLDWLDAQNNIQSLILQSSQRKQELLQLRHNTQAQKQQLIQITNETQRAYIQHEQALTRITQSLNYTLYAPDNGQVDNLYLSKGESIHIEQQLMQLVPKQQALKSLLSVPASQAGFLLESQQVKVKIDGFPYQKYGALDGTITHISQHVLLPKDSTQMPVRLNVPTYTVEVSLAQNRIEAKKESWPLTSGMTVRASIQLDQPSIFEWLVGPLYQAIGK